MEDPLYVLHGELQTPRGGWHSMRAKHSVNHLNTQRLCRCHHFYSMNDHHLHPGANLR